MVPPLLFRKAFPLFIHFVFFTVLDFRLYFTRDKSELSLGTNCTLKEEK